MTRFWHLLAALFLMASMLPLAADAADDTISDEAKIPPYTLPDPLVAEDGTKITTPEQWRTKRRPEILHLFEEHVFGRSPGKHPDMKFTQTSKKADALGGKATRKEVTVLFNGKEDGPKMSILLYVPNKRTAPAPVFVGLNFNGNAACTDEPDVALTQSWVPNKKELGTDNNRQTDKWRASEKSRWAIEMAVDRGYAVATIYCGDIDPDYHDGFKNGVHPLFYKPGQTEPAPNEWGTIAAWAWGLSRAVDYFETDKDLDAKHVAVIGHSRLGKTSLWAGATDERFGIVISNNSGCGGAALSKRIFGETVGRINKSFPHWFCGNHKKYSDNEAAMPVDHHELIALCAPRPCYVASATEDLWADPKGEFLAALGADPVYKLLGTDGLPAKEMPKADQPVMGTLGYHLRTGKHDVTDYDWQQYLSFADKHWGKPK